MSAEEDIGILIKRLLDESIHELGNINVLIAGRTGVGKSTMVNAVFQGDFAETGQGRPVTQTTREISKEGIPLTIWDTRGLEMAAFKESLAELEGIIALRSREQNVQRHIHVAWLCVQEDSRRVEDAEISLHRMLSNHMPVIGVITKARADQGFRAVVQSLLPQTTNVVRVRALSDVLDDGHLLPPMGLTELVHMTAEVLPEAFKRAFIAAQKASLKLKKDAAHKVVVVAATSATTAGATPIPFSDAFVLIPIQVGMFARISAVFGLDFTAAFLGTLIAAVSGATGATLVGRAIVGGALKLIPGAGTLVGGAISAATAASLTTALGEAYVATLAALFEQSGGEPPDAEAIKREFKRRLCGG